MLHDEWIFTCESSGYKKIFMFPNIMFAFLFYNSAQLSNNLREIMQPTAFLCARLPSTRKSFFNATNVIMSLALCL